MKKPKQKQVPYQGLMYLGGAVILIALIIVLVPRPPQASAPTTNTAADTSSVTITTDDGIKLAATVKYPARTSPAPAVVLLHQYGQDRHEWDVYLQRFLDAGLAVLSYDMRGFGDSRLAAIPQDQATHLASLALDLPAVIKYLQQQPNIDPARINLVGASIGADVAYIGSGSNLGVYRTVLLSPVVRVPVFDGHDVAGFAPRGVYGIASEPEKGDLQTFMNTVKDPQQQDIEPGDAHGVALLANTGLVDKIMAWVNR